MNDRIHARGDVGLADAFIALHGLSADEQAAARDWLPELLGIDLGWRAETEDPTSAPPAARETSRPSPFQASLQNLLNQQKETSPGEEPDESPLTDRDRDHAPTLPCNVQWDDPEEPSADAEASTTSPRDQWRTGAPKLPAPTALKADDLPPLQPLFEKRRNRSVLSGALSTSQPDGDPDFERIVALIANREPLVELPRQPTPTTRLGLQLLLDRGRGLLPYHRDQELLLHEIEILAGRDRVQTLHFADSPGHGVGSGLQSEPTRRYLPPAPGVPVVLLTDLGISRRRLFTAGASVKEWLRFVRIVKAASCPLLAIVPTLPSRIPARLRAHFHVLPWSRTTTITTVRGVIGRGLELKS